MKEVTNVDAQWRLRRHFSKFGSLKLAAKHYGVTQPYLSLMQTGKKPITNKFAKDIGLEKVVTITYKVIDKNK